MTYQEAVARLYSLEQTGIKLGLDNIRDFCRRLGDPQQQFLSVHIAGTNGKGTVTALVAEMLRRDGWRVGRYTSPHLRDFRERIEINGRMVGRVAVTEFVAQHWPLIRRRRYSYFEVVTALAFDAFARAGVEVGVIEVGLGGRFDATNIIDPAVSIITQIDFDHERILGRTLGKIAFEKSGIIKTGRPVLVGPVTQEVRSVLERIARERQAPLFDARDVLRTLPSPPKRGFVAAAWQLPLFGTHQIANLGIALASVALLQGMGVEPDPATLRHAARRVHWPGRFQFESTTPRVVYDVAHNPSGAAAFAKTWRALFAGKKGVLLFTAKDDKGYSEMWRSLAPVASRWIGCPLPHSPGIPRAEMESLARSTGTPFEWRDSAQDAYRIMREMTAKAGLSAVVGSHYLVGELIPKHLLLPKQESPRPRQHLRWADILTALRSAGHR
ncbi:MAG: folylpolyglutamate synthase/dihydrofolate synthase family protein [Candidatus Zixiibacteriota bacterium]